MRNDVIKFFQTLPKGLSEQFNQALELYRKSPNINNRILQQMNSSGFSSARLETLLYELKKLHIVTDKDIALAVVAPYETIEVREAEVLNGATKDQKILSSQSDSDGGVTALFATAPDEVKLDIKLRDEFPFLKEATCPNEFKILVADKLNHYEAYVEARKLLMVIVLPPAEGETEPVTKTLNNAEIFAIAKAAVDNFTINQDIYTELEHYRNVGKVLGQHPLLANMKLAETVKGLTNTELSKRKSNLINYINRDKKALATAENKEAVQKLENKISGWENELALVDARLTEIDAK